jgi:magnesium chelatase subunit D
MRTTVPSPAAPAAGPPPPDPAAPDPGHDARLAARLLALDPERLGGAVLRGPPGPGREAWLARLRDLLPATAPLRRVAPQIEDDRLLGGLDLAASLRAGRPVLERGILAETHGGVLILAMAERAAPGLVARLAATLDRGEVHLARDGLDTTLPSRLALLALDEGIAPEEGVDPALADRLAFHLRLDGPDLGDPPDPPGAAAEIAAARPRLARIEAPEALVEGLAGAAQALGIDSLRAPLLALAAARGLAALAGRDTVATDDAAVAARLVLAPRATCMPVPAEPEPPAPEPPAPDSGPEEGRRSGEIPGEILLEAARAALPPGLLAGLGAGRRAGRAPAGGRSPQLRRDPGHGRPAGTRPGRPRGGARLALLATLRAAAPWQRLRRAGGPPAPGRRLLVRPQDLRVRRLLRPVRSTTLFLVDASGSTALHRLAEAKGAVELLLAECYVRRDRVALLAFRGERVELLLPPTRSLARARRELAALPGGGGTPLARALDAGLELAVRLRRQDERPLLVLLTDGRANLARDGTPGRERAEAEALAAARAWRTADLAALLVDASPRPEPRARALAQAAGARYLPLPRADAASLARAVRGAIPDRPHGRAGHD